jgi:hypothetical protein
MGITIANSGSLAVIKATEVCMDWFWQHLFSGFTLELLLVLGGGAVLGYVKRKLPEHASTLLYGAAGATCVAILIFTFTGRAILAKAPPDPITPENVEENVKQWAGNMGMNIGPATMPDSYFAYQLSLPSAPDVPVIVFRGHEKPSYLQFRSAISVSPEHQAAFSKMSQPQVDRIMEQIDLEIGQANLGCTFAQLSAVNSQLHKTIMTGAVLQRGVPIQNLNEQYFTDTFDALTRGISLVRTSVKLALPETSSKEKLSPFFKVQ